MIYKVDPHLLMSLAEAESFVLQNNSGSLFELTYTKDALFLSSPMSLPLQNVAAQDIGTHISLSEKKIRIELRRSAKSLRELIRLPKTADPILPQKALILFDAEASATRWIFESIHLGKDRIQFLYVDQKELKDHVAQDSSSSTQPVLCMLIDEPSYFQLYNRNICVFTEVTPGLWAPFNVDAHLFKNSLSGRFQGSKIHLMLDSLNLIVELPKKGWQDIYTRLNPVFTGQSKHALLREHKPKQIDIPLKFQRLIQKKQPTAWLLLEKDIPSWHQLLNESSEMDLVEWSYLVGSISDRDKVRFPHIRSSSALLLLNKTGSVFPYTGVPLYQWLNSSNIFIPTHYQISPNLRQDTYYKIFNAQPELTQVYLPSSDRTEDVVLQFANKEYPLKDLIKHRMVAERVDLEHFACSGSFSLEYWSSLPPMPKESTVQKSEDETPTLPQSISIDVPPSSKEIEPLNIPPKTKESSLLDWQAHAQKQIDLLLAQKPRLLKTIFDQPQSSKAWMQLYGLYTKLSELYTQTEDMNKLDGQIRAELLFSRLRRTAEQILVTTPAGKIKIEAINKEHIDSLFLEILTLKNPSDSELLSWQKALKNKSIGNTNILVWWKCWELIITKTSNIALYKDCCETIEQELRNTGLGAKEFPDELLNALKKVHLSSEVTEQPINAHGQLIKLITDPYWKGFCSYMVALLIDSKLLEGSSEEYLNLFLEQEQKVLNSDSDSRGNAFRNGKIRHLLMETHYQGLNHLSAESPQDKITQKWHSALMELQKTELEHFDQLMSATLNSMGKIFSIGSNLEQQTHFSRIKERYLHHPNQAFELLKEDLEYLKGKDLLGIPYIIGLREELSFLLLSECSEQIFGVLNNLLVWLGEQQNRGSKRWMLGIVLVLQPFSTDELLSSAFSNIEHYIHQQKGPISFQISKFSKMLLASVQLLPAEERAHYIQRLFKLLSSIDTGPKHMFSFLLLSLKALSTDILYIETQKSMFLKKAEIRLIKQMEHTHTALS